MGFKKCCVDCEYMFFVDEELGEMDCSHGNATVENGAPEMIVSDFHDCPFFEEKNE